MPKLRSNGSDLRKTCEWMECGKDGNSTEVCLCESDSIPLPSIYFMHPSALVLILHHHTQQQSRNACVFNGHEQEKQPSSLPSPPPSKNSYPHQHPPHTTKPTATVLEWRETYSMKDCSSGSEVAGWIFGPSASFLSSFFRVARYTPPNVVAHVPRTN